jgi:hypothetical protein
MVALGPVTRRAVRQTRYERGSAGAGVGRNPVMVALGHVTRRAVRQTSWRYSQELGSLAAKPVPSSCARSSTVALSPGCRRCRT